MTGMKALPGGTAGRRRFAALLGLSLLLLPAAVPATTCHCFRDRTYDPAEPSKVDPYVLSTVGNSFFARAFGIDKKAVVKARMSGVSGEDLWIAYYASPAEGKSPGTLMAVRRNAPSWASVLTQPRGGGGPFPAAAAAGGADRDLARLAAGSVLRSTLGAEEGELEALSAAGATLAETVASAVISRWDGRSPSELLRSVRGGRSTWGSLLHGQGIAPSEAEERIAELFEDGRGGAAEP